MNGRKHQPRSKMTFANVIRTALTLLLFTSPDGSFAFTLPIPTRTERLSVTFREKLISLNDSTLKEDDRDIIVPRLFNDEDEPPSLLEQLAIRVSESVKSWAETQNQQSSQSSSTATTYSSSVFDIQNAEALRAQTKTIVRVGVPSVLLALLAWAAYPFLSMGIANLQIYDGDVAEVLYQDSSQYVQNILTSTGLIFSILTGYTFYFMYLQQEQVFYALFREVTEAKSLLEQVSLMCAGRDIYPQALECVSSYVRDDLKGLTRIDPVQTLAERPMDDPLEGIMYLTSVGVPGRIYDTIKSLRDARAYRLGAMQRKLPEVHIILLRTLGFLVLTTFPVCGSGSQVIGGMDILNVQSFLFGLIVFGIVIVLNVVNELWKPKGGAYNVDGVLAVMIRGLEEELDERMSGAIVGGCNYLDFDDDNMGGLEDISNLPSQTDDIIESAIATDQAQPQSRRGKIRNWVRNSVGRRN